MENFYNLEEKAIRKEKEPHFISFRLLEALSGEKTKTVAGELVDKGAYLWGVEDKDLGRGIFNHVLITSRVAYAIARELKEKQVKGYENIDPRFVVEGAILHDITKLYGEQRENLTPELKEQLGLKKDFTEISLESNDAGTSWLKGLNFSSEVYEAIRENDEPQKIIDNPYWKIIVLADYMVGQKVMSIDERLQDIKTRWIDQPMAVGKAPRIPADNWQRAEQNVKQVAEEIFGVLGTTDQKLIEKHQLDNEASKNRWEKFLRATDKKGQEERAKYLVKKFIG